MSKTVKFKKVKDLQKKKSKNVNILIKIMSKMSKEKKETCAFD